MDLLFPLNCMNLLTIFNYLFSLRKVKIFFMTDKSDTILDHGLYLFFLRLFSLIFYQIMKTSIKSNLILLFIHFLLIDFDLYILYIKL